jgi:hypothetical protein
MNLLTWTRRLRRSTRRRRSTGLAVESIEKRLAPSPTIPLPPPQVSSMVEHGLPHQFAPVIGRAVPAGREQPPDPC